MALNANVVWEVRTSGNAANAGGFNSGAAGTDRSQQDSPHVTIDGATITATVHTTTTQLNIVGYTVIAGDVGNLVRIAGGTMTAGTYEITAVDTGNNRWTIDRSGGTAGQTGTGRMGGAQSDPALVAAAIAASSTAGNTVHVKAGTYSITSATPNVAGGCVSLATVRSFWRGYQTTRDDLGTKPVLQASGISSATLFAVAVGELRVINIEVDGAGLTAMLGFSSTNVRVAFDLCTARNCTNGGFSSTSVNVRFVRCLATGCSTVEAFAGVHFIGCVASSNTITGFVLISPNVGTAMRCIAYGNSGASSDGFVVGVGSTYCVNCVAYGNGRDGFGLGSASSVYLLNCIAENNGQYGYAGTGASNFLQSCAAYNNTSGATNLTGATPRNVDFVTGTGSFFTSAGAGDFSLNNTAGAGAAARAAGIPGAFPGGLTTGYLDIGAAQHQDPGGLLRHPGMAGGLNA